jgi:hypothetical protein
MLPIIYVPEIIARGMKSFREIFCRAEGFEHVCRFITGLIISPHKTLQGIYDLFTRADPSLRRHQELRLRGATDGLVSNGGNRRGL